MSIPILQADAKRGMEQLGSFSNEELDTILNNDEKIEEIISNIENSYLKEIEEEKDNIIAQNNSMAESNLSREPELVEGREKLNSQYEEITRLTKVVDEKAAELRQKGGDMSIETALALLRTAASEMEEDSDNCAKKFLDGEAELESFLDEFQIKRKLMHMRLVKADKLSKILQRGDPSLGQSVPNYINAPPMALNRDYFPGVPVSPPMGGVPYPVGPINMPLPGSANYFQNFGGL
ncbi:vacuolar protein sorting-associated protein 37B [Anthonomus grandis grandis]|uniref:vacuolar protein sorting-associated protein 37B n=1 Tax=Anthonomus grandis grandis TaxID=2921223 RepID=UPI0021653367|nr:vacuolar protein sorting-associated protein 37B [Anthonomus grandis grandis]